MVPYLMAWLTYLQYGNRGKVRMIMTMPQALQ